MKNLGLAIVGYGGLGEQHGTLLRGVGCFTVRGVFDVLEERRRAAVRNGFFAYKNFEEVLKSRDVDVVLVVTPNHLHKELSIRALRAGKHVICDKPVTLGSAELEEILAAAKECGRLFAVHQNRRWDEDFLVMKKLMDDKTIGDVYHIETRVMGSRGIPGDWRHEKAYGGGMMLDWGVHLIDRLLTMTDEKVKSLYCQMSYVLKNSVDDGFRLLLSFEGGKTALVEVQTNNLITLPKWYMLGTGGSAVIRDWEMNGEVVTLKSYESPDAKPVVKGAGLSKTMAPRDESTVSTRPIPRLQSDVRDFYRNVAGAIAGTEPLLVKNSESLRVMRLVDAAFLSSRQNAVIPFE